MSNVGQSKSESGSRGSFNIITVLGPIFFLSGCSALIFETLWFRLAGLAFGNSIWASALILSSFMGGLALGNGLAAKYGGRVKRPIHFYASIELIVAVSGIALVLVFPTLTEILTPVFRPLLKQPFLLNPLRVTISFLLMMIPSTAMGMTLPLLVKALYADRPNFGQTLGALYGWNTLGAVAGSLLGEVWLIKVFGVAGTGFCAGLLNALAASGAIYVTKRIAGRPAAEAINAEDASRSTFYSQGGGLLLAAFLAGGVMLALEVVWFRFLQLFLPGTSLIFAIMLSIVLAGIGLGGFLASLWFRIDPRAHRFLFVFVLLSGLLIVLVYYYFPFCLDAYRRTSKWFPEWYFLSLPVCLMFPVSLSSGVLFSMIGHAAHEVIGGEAKTAGLVTMFNTIGAMIGPLIAGFLLIPYLGMERSFFILMLVYGAASLLVISKAHWSGIGKVVFHTLAAAVFIAGLVFFPFGCMEKFIKMASAKYRGDGSKIVAVREGVTETIQYLRNDFLGQPLFYRLVTNSFSMSGTISCSKRYMNYYVYFPVAVHSDPKTAVLISFGVGSTAKALTNTRSLESIDVVDISKDILDMSSIVFPNPEDNPINDERVHVHVEDGRFFLQTTPKKYDIITSEPPPPKMAGVVNLYTQEYFQLIHDRLNDGGITTYWLPVYQLKEHETRAILKAFVNVFDDCTLWSGRGFDWMMVGVKNSKGPVSEAYFKRQWGDPVVSSGMRALGFERPEQLAATFMMDAADLQKLTEFTQPLTDNYPKRIGERGGASEEDNHLYHIYMDLNRAMARFQNSPQIKAIWPRSLIAKSLPFFSYQKAFNEVLTTDRLGASGLHLLLTESDLRIPVLWAYKSPETKQKIIDRIDGADKESNPTVLYNLGMRAMADREYLEAEQYFAKIEALQPDRGLAYLRVYMLCLAGRTDSALELIKEKEDFFQNTKGMDKFLNWLTKTFDFKNPLGSG